jgi:nucleoside-diphosphate-sugar epimerase
MILVAGATGRLGEMVTHRPLERGNDVLICVRHNSPSVDRSPAGCLD